jgi:hypothetical protein
LIRHIGIVLATLTVLAAGAGCGSSDGGAPPFTVRADTTATAGAISKAKFLARANRVCRSAWPTILENYAKYAQRHAERLSGERLFAKSVRSSFLAGLDFYVFDGIHRTPAPRADRAQVERVLGDLQRAVELGQRRISIRTLGQFATLFEGYNQAAHRYGLDECLVDGTKLLRVEAF